MMNVAPCPKTQSPAPEPTALTSSLGRIQKVHIESSAFEGCGR